MIKRCRLPEPPSQREPSLGRSSCPGRLAVSAFVLTRPRMVLRRTLASLMLGFPSRGLFPVIGRQRHSPNVTWLIKFDSTVPRVLRINIGNPSCSPLIRQVDKNRDPHSLPQLNSGCDQCSMKVDDDGLAIAGPILSVTLDSDSDLERHTSTSSGLMKRRCGGHE